ncbi:hypothetical protein BN946_scf184976.g15 [Trametes cinnabarina]|uniref:Uncharacterized protein n=1 Tax=Pycnoporus cinnabarinus TaxID=5643 RepID=A0A060S576_PYCCI|nr:hypothetical protein BN946_scf184976.g15 [Trametes cinnabarina]
MPTKAHRPSGPTRTHSRTSSGSSSKLGLNLQFTQKDPAPPSRVSDKAKKSNHFHHEFLRSNSGIRVHSREHIQPAALRRAPTPSNAKQAGSKQKVDFSISSPDEDDDDAWVSSESGAATPNNASEAANTPVEQVIQRLQPTAHTQHLQLNAASGNDAAHDVATPKAASSALPRVDIARTPSQHTLAPTAHDYAVQASQPQGLTSSNYIQSDQHHPGPDIQISTPTPPVSVSKARSETHSPPRRSPDMAPKRQSMTRPPSTHSINSRSDGPPLRPHPLIRGHSYGHGHGFAAKPAPLAPLATVLPDSASGQMSTASSSPTSLRAGSPTSIRTASGSPSISSPSSVSPAHRQLRRTSTSSARSTATLPVQSSSSDRSSRGNHDRQRTLSTISSSSSIAALTHSLTLRPTPSPPRTPVQITAHFPPPEQTAALESIHPLLPPPYLSAHLTVLAYRNPIAESYDRVMRAKQGR